MYAGFSKSLSKQKDSYHQFFHKQKKTFLKRFSFLFYFNFIFGAALYIITGLLMSQFPNLISYIHHHRFPYNKITKTCISMIIFHRLEIIAQKDGKLNIYHENTGAWSIEMDSTDENKRQIITDALKDKNLI